MSGGSTNIPIRKYGEFSFPVPRQPRIRIWGSPEFYPDGLWVHAVDDPGDCFQFTEGMPKMPFQFRMDRGKWTTATIADFIFLRRGTDSGRLEGWIYISLEKLGQPKYTIYVYDDGKRVGTKFGSYQGARQEPVPFPDDGENYFWEMSDYLGLWLWLYRLYGEPPA